MRAGAALAITGPNGAGKSTLGLTLAGLLPPASGSPHRRARARRRCRTAARSGGRRGSCSPASARCSRIPSTSCSRRPCAKSSRSGPRALGLGATETAARVDELLERLRLAPLARANPYTLSGGEKRRLTVAAALATAPRVLVLDEPTFGQDARTWAELVALLARLRDEGSAIVAITHDLDVVEALHAERFALRGARR